MAVLSRFALSPRVVLATYPAAPIPKSTKQGPDKRAEGSEASFPWEETRALLSPVRWGLTGAAQCRRTVDAKDHSSCCMNRSSKKFMRDEIKWGKL